VSPHVVRHGTAMALLQSSVDVAVIALWLGHENIETTNVYVRANLATKEKALAKVTPIRHPIPAIPGERSIVGVLGIALTALLRGAFGLLPAFCLSPAAAPETSSPLPTSPRPLG
jgi:hypothetical protein